MLTRSLLVLMFFLATGTAQQQQAFPRFNHISKHIHGAVDGATDTAGQPDNHIAPIAQRGNTMQGSLDTGSIVFGESTHASGNEIEIFSRNRGFRQVHRTVRKSRFRLSSEVQNDFHHGLEIGKPVERILQVWRHHTKQEIEVIRDFFPWHLVT